MESFRILALGGGGTRGILHVGAIRYLEEIGAKFDEIYGCSIGSIFAIGLAFGLNSEAMERMASKFKTLDSILFNGLTIDMLEDNFMVKGLFNMDNLEAFFVNMFLEEGIDLRGKTISDSPILLRICASNISKQCLAVFQGSVPIIKAFRASCCIPLIFCPQEINNNLYIDGGYLTNTMVDYVPENLREKTLEISIRFESITLNPENIKSLSYPEFLYSLYKTSCIYERKTRHHRNDIQLFYKLPSGISDVSDKHRKEMIQVGYELARRFFAKRTG
jgi:predicted acylesterase/phospholipase RssA|uniref:PNPLA domain-containing protein n=1 Tax=viral metagenome TaxID=1070528 RepID=A0A6C0CR08_9ZZZZ